MTKHLALALVCIFYFIANLKAETSGVFLGNFVRQPTVCVPIPSYLRLCRNVGYDRMVLPNLLNHESLGEVQQQASSFVPLLKRGCHPHLQEFLCSLFAPVCLPPGSAVTGPIPPCKSLCRSVERACTPLMQQHNFNWPSILNCSKFSEKEPCVNLGTESNPAIPAPSREPSNTCAPCGTGLERDTLRDNYCASEFVLKIRMKRMKKRRSRGTREIVADRRKRIIYKRGPLTRRDLKRMKLIVRGARKCVCPPVDELQTGSTGRRGRRHQHFFLVMGRKVQKKMLVTALHLWPKRHRLLNQMSKTRFGASQCPEFGNASLS